MGPEPSAEARIHRRSPGGTRQRLGNLARTGESDSGARFVAGGRLGLGLLVFPSGFLGIFAGVEGTVVASTTRLLVAGQDAGRVQNPTFGFALAVRARLF